VDQAKQKIPTLAEVEAEVLAEGREWTRRRLEERLQELAEQSGEVFPPEPKPGSGAPATSAAVANAGGPRGAGGVVRPRRPRR
jgi:hypothetical protein